MYQNNYTNIPEQYLELLRNGPNENTVISGSGVSVGCGQLCLQIYLEPDLLIGVKIEERPKIWLMDNGKVVVKSTEITRDFGYGWLKKAGGVYKEFDFKPE